MHKINTNTATATNEFTDGDSSGSIPATDLSADWFNTVQREICNAVEKSGQTLSDTNNEQLYNAITTFGIKPIYSDGNFQVPSTYKGSIALLCEAKNFTISGSFKNDCFVFIVPMWSASSTVEEITVTYQQWTYKIRNGFGLVALADNGFNHDTGLLGMQFPVSSNGKNIKTDKVTANSIAAGSVKSDAYFDSLVEFEYREDETGLQQWQRFQLASAWQVGQVKRVLCTNAATTGTEVFIYKNESGQWMTVNFWPSCYREFLWDGKTYSSGGYSYAVLRLNGSPA